MTIFIVYKLKLFGTYVKVYSYACTQTALCKINTQYNRIPVRNDTISIRILHLLSSYDFMSYDKVNTKYFNLLSIR